MRTRFGTVLVVAVALVIGGVAGWLAAGAWCGAAVSSKPPYRGDASLECNNGRARSPSAPKALVKMEREMLVTQTVKSFGIPDGDAVELRATLDEVRDATRFMYFEEK